MRLLQLLIILSFFWQNSSFASGPKEYRIRLSLNDYFIVKDTEEYKVTLQKQLILRFANVQVTPQNGKDFDLLLFFKSDTPDLAQFDTAQKIRDNLYQAATPYLPYVVETEVALREFFWKNRRGYLTILSDRQLADKEQIPAGVFKYLTKGMVRLSTDSVLGFSLMTNELGTDSYNQHLAYVKSFVQE